MHLVCRRQNLARFSFLASAKTPTPSCQAYASCCVQRGTIVKAVDEVTVSGVQEDRAEKNRETEPEARRSTNRGGGDLDPLILAVQISPPSPPHFDHLHLAPRHTCST